MDMAGYCSVRNMERPLWEAENEYLGVIAALNKEISQGNSSLRAELARTYGHLASVYSRAVLISEEEKTLNLALEIWKDLAAKGDKECRLELARKYLSLGIVYQYQGKWDGAEMVLVRSREILTMLSNADSRLKAELSQCVVVLGNTYWLMGRLEDAEREMLRAISLENELPFEAPDMMLKSLGFAHARLAEIYRKHFNVSDAESHMLRSIEIYIRVREQAVVRRILLKNYEFLIDLYQSTGRNADELARIQSMLKDE